MLASTALAEPHPPINLGIGSRERLGTSPWLALVLAVLVGLAVFTLIWKMRKTFGLKE